MVAGLGQELWPYSIYIERADLSMDSRRGLFVTAL